MFLGVIIYSKIMTEVVAEMDKRLYLRMVTDVKKTDLKRIQQIIGESMKEKDERELIKEIENSVKTDYNTNDKKSAPLFPGVNQKDVEDLLYQAYSKNFAGVNLFESKNKTLLIKFASNMEKELV